jgi:hypothetical protein
MRAINFNSLDIWLSSKNQYYQTKYAYSPGSVLFNSVLPITRQAVSRHVTRKSPHTEGHFLYQEWCFNLTTKQLSATFILYYNSNKLFVTNSTKQNRSSEANSWPRNSSPFIETQGTSLSSEEPTTALHFEPD